MMEKLDLANTKVVKRWVPTDLLFTGGLSAAQNRLSSDQHHNSVFSPLVNIDPYMNAIQMLSTGGPVSDEFHEFERGRVHSRPYNAAAREKNLRSKLAWTGSLFRRTLPFVEELSQDRLFVRDGLLDACIAKFHMKDWMQVAMPKNVAKLWDSRSADQLDLVCKGQDRTQIYTPIMHSAYRNYKYSRRGYMRLDMIRKYLGPNLANMSLLDIGCNSGYYVFHFRRQGMKVMGIDIDTEHLAIAKAQVPMYKLDVDLLNVSLQDLPVERPFDVVLAMSVIWHILGWGKMPAAMSESELISKINQIVGKYLFWESGPDPDREIKLLREKTELSEFKQLGTTSATGIDNRIFGVFFRSSTADL